MNWASIPIGEVGAVFDGPHATPKPADHGPIFLGIKNIRPDGHLDFSDIRHVSPEEYPRWTKRVTPTHGDVVFTYEATLHRYALIPEGFVGCLGRRTALVRPDPSRVDSRFLYYQFRSPQWWAKMEQEKLVGATVDRIPVGKFPDFEILVPDLPVQRRIADILSAYDDLIENNNRRMALLEESIHLLYREWFVYLRFPGHERVEVVDGVPEGWERLTLKEVLTLNYGKSLTKKTRVPGPVPVYGSSGAVGWHNKSLIDGHGIIVGRKGNVGSVYWSDVPYFPIDTVYYVSPEEASLFTYAMLKSQTFVSSDAAVPGLNRNYAYSIKVLRPHAALVEEFNRVARTAWSQKANLEEQNRKLREARDLLLPRLMDGRIPV